MKRFLVWAIFFFCSLLAAEEEFYDEPEDADITPPSLVTLTSLPSSLVNYSVNILSGDLLTSAQDLVVSGPDPYILGHSFSSSHVEEEGTLASGWNFSHYHLLRVFQPDGINFASSNRHDHHTRQNDGGHCVHGDPEDSGKNPYTYLFLTEPSGHRLLFKGDGWAKHFQLVKKNSGYTNVCGGELSGKTNIKNITTTWHCKSDRWHAHFPDGTRRIYGRRKAIHEPGVSHRNWRDYHLVWEVLPSGNFRIYHYDGEEKISSIRSYNHDGSRLLHWIKFSHKKHSIVVSTSDKLKVRYLLQKMPHGRTTLSSIKREGLAATNFTHCKRHDPHRLISIWSDTGYYAESKYYHTSSNRMGSNNFSFSNTKQKECSHRKVREQKSPVGLAGSKWSTHRYFYFKKSAIVKDAYGARTRYFWDENKRLTKIARFDSNKKLLMSETFSWHQGHLTTHTLRDEQDHVRLSKEYHYDERGNVTKETISGLNIEKQTIHREFSNDGFNNLLSEEDPEENFTYYEYYPKRNLIKAKFLCNKKEIKKREFFTYDKNACLVQHIIDDGSSRDKDNLRDVTERHLTKITPRKKRPHFGEPRIIYKYALQNGKNVLLSKTIHIFSKKGFISEERLYDSKEQLCSTTHYTRDALGRVISTSDGLGRTTLLSYDQAGRLTRTETPTLITTNSYDKMGNLIVQEDKDKEGTTLINRYTYDLLGRKSSHINPQGHATHFFYDALNRITKITSPQGVTKHYSYEKLGALVTETDERGYKTKTTFDALGRIVSKKLPDQTEVYSIYDSRGNCIEETSPNGTSTYKKYDFLNRLISSTTEEAKTTYTYNTFHLLTTTTPTHETTHYTYDFAGRKTSQFQKDHTITYTYDSKSRLHTETCGDCTKYFAYDEADRLITESNRGKTSRWEKRVAYDTDDNVIEETIGLATSTMRFDAFKRLIKRTDAEGNTWHIHYDDHFVNSWNDEVVKKRLLHPTGVFEEELYDIRGFRISLKRFDPLGTIISDKEFAYDACGNCLRECEHCFGGEKESITTLYSWGPLNRLESMEEGAHTPEAKKTTFSYNNYGQKEKTTDSAGNSIHHLYDSKGRLCQFHGFRFNYSYLYDASDRLTQVINNDTKQSTLRTYTPYGDLSSETLETGLTIQYEYDSTGRISRLTLPDTSHIEYQHDLFLESISRNGWSYQVLKRDRAGNTLSAKLPKNAGELQSSYDNLNRKVKTSHPTYEQELLKFDPAGNLLEMKENGKISSYSYTSLYQLQEEKSHVDRSYAYNALHDRLSHKTDALHSILHDGKRSFTYDRRGNRTTMDDVAYVYDGLDRLVEVKTPKETIHYAYDAFNRRLEKTSSRCHEQYLYVDQNEIGAVDSHGDIVQLRILGEGLGAEIGASVAFEFAGKLFIPIHDHRGNVTTLLDEEGEVIERYRYDAYGVEEATSNLNPWRFSSKRVDPETGFVYFGRRYYDPSLGSWITSDPLGPEAGPNLYAYALCNPMMKFDLYGLIEEDADGNHASLDIQTVYVSNENGQLVFERNGEIIHPFYQEYGELFDIYSQYQESLQSTEMLPQPSFLENSWEFTKEYSIVAAEGVCLATDIFSIGLLLFPAPQTKIAGASLQLGARTALKALKAYRIQVAKSISKITTQATQQLWRPNNSRYLPKNPNDLFKFGYKEISHPNAIRSGHRTFQNPHTGDKIRFDVAKPGRRGHAAKDHYHRENLKGTGKRDAFIDKNGKPCPDGSPESHLYPE